MAGTFPMAFVTREPPLTALKLDRDYVQISAVMSAACLHVNINAVYFFTIDHTHHKYFTTSVPIRPQDEQSLTRQPEFGRQ